jgi:hypothetical protein
MKILRTSIVTLLVASLAACMTVGTRFDLAKADQLTPGVSTMSDAIKLLGPVRAETAMQNNSKLLQWQYVQGTPVGGSGAHLAILFDASGKMVRITHKSSTGQ